MKLLSREALREHLRHERGAALVELAFALPLLAAVLVGTADFARAFYWGMALTTAARTGAQWGALSTTNAADTATMRSKALSAASTDIPSLSVSDITATETCSCAPNAPSSAAFSYTTPSPNTCAGSCTSGNHLVTLVTVGASKTFTTIVSYPGIPHSIPMTRSATMRAQ